jgi:predicted secreted protein
MALRWYSRVVAFGLVLAFGLAPAHAAEEDPSENDKMNRVRLQAQSSKQVANDLMQAMLAVEMEDRDPAKLADTINRTMAWALKRARSTKGVTVQSGGYQTYPVRKEGQIVRWRASQQVLLESPDSDRMTALIGELQSQLQLKSLGFTVSPEARRATENELIDAALNRFKERAEIVRKNLAAAGYQIVEVAIHTSGAQPIRPIPAGRAMAVMRQEVAPPAVEAGRSEVTVSVTGTIQLD